MQQKMTKEKFEQILTDLNSCLNTYDRYFYSKKIYELYLANGEKVKYSIPESSVPHLLGVNTNYLNSTSFFTTETKSSNEVFRKLCDEDNWYSLYKKIGDGLLNPDELFSDEIVNKINAFEENIKCNIYNILFVCKLDRDKIHNQGKEFMDVEYLLFNKIQDKYLMLGLIRNEKGYLVAKSSQYFNSEDEFRNQMDYVLCGQEITFAYKSEIISQFSESKPYILPFENKQEKVKNLGIYKDIFSCSIDVLQDYCFSIDTNAVQYRICKEIAEIMAKEEVIDANILMSKYGFVPMAVRMIIDQYNDRLCNSYSEEGHKKYSEMEKELDCLKKENALLTSKNEEMATNIEQQNDQIIQLQSENSELTECCESIQKTLKLHFIK